MRVKNSIKNAIVAIIMNIITILIGFVAQRIFLHSLGVEYLGINGLFTNILSMLGIVELGLGSAIVYHLYKPIAENDIETIKSLMKFYKISYRIIAILILGIGLIIIPFLGIIVGETSISDNIIYIYILCLFDVVASYLLTYKRSILYANQKTYIVNLIHIGYLLFMNITQIIVLIITKNYILYLWIKIICRIIENIIVTIISNKMYSYIKDKNIIPLSKKFKTSIFLKVKGLLFHKIASVIVFGTDNILISSFFGVTFVGLYSNYNMIIQALSNLFAQVFSSITASVGNLLVENDSKKNNSAYKKLLFLNSWLFAFAGTGLLCIIEPFVTLWLGREYILPFSVLIVLVINFYIQGMRKTCNTFKEAAGVFYEDRFVPIIESLINIVASIILLKIFGLAGVFMGTIVSTGIVFFYSYPKYVYLPLCKNSFKEYLKEYLYYIVITVFAIVPTFYLTTLFIVENVFFKIVINIVITLIVPNLIYFFITRKTEEFKYYKSLIKKMFKRIKEKKIKTIDCHN